MTNEQLVGVVLRTVGVLFAINAAIQLIWWLPWVFQTPSDKWLFAVSYNAVWFVMGLALVIKPIAIARLFLPKTSQPENPASTPWSLVEFHSVMFSVLGAYLIATTATNLRALEDLALSIIGSVSERALPSWDTIRMNADYLLRLTAGLWLLFGADGLRRLIWRVRKLGQEGES